ncbi:MAG: 23S rRNA (guanine(745)-N(1))-methyltransferase [Candidatus Pelagadaptatus aseana]|uniref:putative RNA methyltransferase n=1 Tax=Candidatus Pelagadaptatus aseana TaxID=3120508 RepID=UPI0039B1449F
MIWACPVCSEPLLLQQRQLICSNNHRFDQARQGYFNLMQANRKGSRDPGDTREMMLARRDFLRQGFYQPLVDLLSHWLAEHPSQELSMLDSGCGEGYYLQQLSRNAGDKMIQAHGLDISKEAIKLAARSQPDSQWVVASSFRLPVKSDSVDILLRVFAPGCDLEARRVLRESGELWRVAPADNHLSELKQRLYDKVQAHTEPPAPSGFELLQQERVTMNCELSSNESVQQLLTMTPFVWQAAKARQQAVLGLNELSVTADFWVQRYRVASDND